MTQAACGCVSSIYVGLAVICNWKYHGTYVSFSTCRRYYLVTERLLCIWLKTQRHVSLRSIAYYLKRPALIENPVESSDTRNYTTVLKAAFPFGRKCFSRMYDLYCNFQRTRVRGGEDNLFYSRRTSIPRKIAARFPPQIANFTTVFSRLLLRLHTPVPLCIRFLFGCK